MDKLILQNLNKELKRQNTNIELIASENYVSKDVMKLQGSVFTNKYAEGYPSKRYYGGCENVDAVEQLAINYLCQLFHCKYANVQPHCGSSANQAAYRALVPIGATVMGMDLSAGGHLTHGHKLSFSGQDYNIVSYGVNAKTGLIDYDEIKSKIYEYKPRMVIAGASAYPRKIDFKKISAIIKEYNKQTELAIMSDQELLETDIPKRIEDAHCYFMVDMAHIAGLVAAGLHQNPCDYADIVTSTTHKTLRGPRGGIILTNDEEIIKKVNKAVFPGVQGGPLEHVIAAKAQCFYEALQPKFKAYQKQLVKNIAAMADAFKKHNVQLITDGTDNHLILVNVYNSFGITGKEAETLLDEINITVNKNTIPGETLSPMVASGIRIGSPAMTTRGFKEKDFIEIADIICCALHKVQPKEELKKRVKKLTKKHQIYIKGDLIWKMKNLY